VNEKHFVVATAGHVDHGKTALVQALTGTDPDRLPEEKKRKITIELGFAHLELADSSKPESPLSISLIDVPGHEDFVRNMIAGVGSIDLALLAIAADDGWMRQTEEHLQILHYLRVPQLLVALTKSDLNDSVNVITDIKEQLRETEYSAAPIVPVSARTRHGLEHLKETLGSLLGTAQPQRDIKKPRLFVDRAFTLPGIGPVVTGTLSGGTLSPNHSVFIHPQGFATRVRSIQTHRAHVTMAQPGMRVGINLADLPKTAIAARTLRGSVLSTQEDEASTTVDVEIERSGRLQRSEPASRPIKSGAAIHLHHGTRRIPAVLILAGQDELPIGERGIAELRLSAPILAAFGDRFVIRDRSEQHTLGGGVILDPKANPKSFRHEAQQKLLVARAARPNDVKICVGSELIRWNWRIASDLLRNSNFSADQVDAAVCDLGAEGQLVRHGTIVADARAWQGFRNRAAELIDRAHKVHPQQKGLELTTLRSEFQNLDSNAMEALIQDLCTSDFVRRDSAIARASHRTSLPAELQPAAKKIMVLLAEKPFDPPGRALLAPDANHRQTVRYLIDQGDVVELGPEVLISREAFALAREMITEFLSARGSATLSQLREAMNTSRRVAVPLLERFDRERVTRRSGDFRTLAPGSVATVTSAPR